MAGDADKGIGIAAIAAKHPDWFSDDVIPESAGGEPYIDPDQRWVGTCLSAFGIMFNREVLDRLQIENEPTSWEDLAHPYFFKQIALADPTKSGSANKAFEMLIQEQMHKALARLGKESPELGMMERENLAVREGWKKGLQLILKIGANARYFTESSEKIPADIASGNAAAGMCIDFYGRSYVQRLEELNPGVIPRVGYITPAGGSSVGADPIGMFRGAPNPELATAFMEFVISPEGQGIWGFRVGVPGGPKRNTLHRMPIRKDIYQGEEVALLSDPNVRPYEYSENFEYRSDWTSRAFTSIRFIIRAMCIDSHEELRLAWKEVHSRGFPEKATEVLLDFDVVNYDSVMGSMRKVINSDDWERKARLAKELRDLFKSNYKKAIEQARKRNKTP